MIELAAALVFVGVVGGIVGMWLIAERRRAMKGRLAEVAVLTDSVDETLLRQRRPLDGWRRAAATLSWHGRLATLIEQSGQRWRPTDVALVMTILGIAGGAVVWWRTDAALFALVGAAGAASLPVLHLGWRRLQRLKAFERLFPDALDVMTRSLRAGHALGGAIQHVGENSPDPVGQEFQRVAEEIRLGVEPTAALGRLQRRVPTPDVVFFCVAIRIQRTAGGNLAEILDRLSEVIRERFKLLSQARALAAQHKWSAVCVGASPLVFAMVFGLMQPNYFEPLWRSEHRVLLLGAGLVLEVIGFLAIWKIARIEV